MGSELTTFIEGGIKPTVTQQKISIGGQAADVTRMSWSAGGSSVEAFSIEFGDTATTSQGSVAGVTLPNKPTAAGSAQSLQALMSDDQFLAILVLAVLMSNNGKLNLGDTNKTRTPRDRENDTNNSRSNQNTPSRSDLETMMERVLERLGRTDTKPRSSETPAPRTDAGTSQPRVTADSGSAPQRPAPAVTTDSGRVAPGTTTPLLTPVTQSPEWMSAKSDYDTARGAADAATNAAGAAVKDYTQLAGEAQTASDEAMALEGQGNKAGAKAAAQRAKTLSAQAKAAAQKADRLKGEAQSALDRVNRCQARMNAILVSAGQEPRFKGPSTLNEDIASFNEMAETAGLRALDQNMTALETRVTQPVAPQAADTPTSTGAPASKPNPMVTSGPPADKPNPQPIVHDSDRDPQSRKYRPDADTPKTSVAPAKVSTSATSPSDAAGSAPATPVTTSSTGKATNASAHTDFLNWLKNNYASLASRSKSGRLGAKELAAAINQWNIQHSENRVHLGSADTDGNGKIEGPAEYESKDFKDNILDVLNNGVAREYTPDVTPADLVALLRDQKGLRFSGTGAHKITEHPEFLEYLYTNIDQYGKTHKDFLTNKEIATAINAWNKSHPENKVDISQFDSTPHGGRPDGVIGGYYRGINEYDRQDFYNAFYPISQLVDDPSTIDSYYISRGDLRVAINQLRQGKSL